MWCLYFGLKMSSEKFIFPYCVERPPHGHEVMPIDDSSLKQDA